MSVPAKILYESIAALIAADPAVLGLATFLKVFPILSPYDPSVTSEAAGLTLGSGTLNGIASTVVPVSGLDPLSGQYKILAVPPAGGWTWSYDGVTPAPSVSIFGYGLFDATDPTALFALTDKINPPLVLAGPALVVLDEFYFLLPIPPLT